ncbi:unnamed protein product [Merluccius merluccius]
MPPYHRAGTERNPWVVLSSALLALSQGPEVPVDLGQEVLSMVRSLYSTKHKLPAQCVGHIAAKLQGQTGLKLMAESGDAKLLQQTLEQINSMSQHLHNLALRCV